MLRALTSCAQSWNVPQGNSNAGTDTFAHAHTPRRQAVRTRIHIQGEHAAEVPVQHDMHHLDHDSDVPNAQGGRDRRSDKPAPGPDGGQDSDNADNDAGQRDHHTPDRDGQLAEHCNHAHTDAPDTHVPDAPTQPAGWRALPRLLLIGFVRAYQMLLSPLLPASCRYYPTCSA